MGLALSAVTLVVPDYDVAIAFYADGLGFEVRADLLQGPGKRWVLVAPPGGSTQLNGLASLLGVEPWRSGALEYAPTRGEVVPFVVSIDGTTNDPTGSAGTLSLSRPSFVAPLSQGVVVCAACHRLPSPCWPCCGRGAYPPC